MKKNSSISIGIYLTVIAMLFAVTFVSNQVITVLSENAPVSNRKCVIIDAGHGGMDGGATSCTGILESNLNLDIALRLNDLMHLLGIDTKMIRTTDCSIDIQGETIAAKKASDLKERVRIANSTENAIVVSIHQNYFSQSQYSGAQVFYAADESSRSLAEQLQKELVNNLNIGSNRMAKKASGIYLMEHIQCPGILVECGFLSNPQEEALLRDVAYQNKLCSVIASVCSRYLHQNTEIT